MYKLIVICIFFRICVNAQTTVTTNLVKDINIGIGNGLSNVVFAGMNGKFYFAASDGALGEELWVSNGSNAGTVLVKDINPGVAGSSPSDFFVDGNKLYFSADDGTNGRELWVSDGTTAGTTLVADLYAGSNSSNSGTYGYAILSNTVFIAAQTGPSAYDKFLYKTNGTTAGTQLVSNAAGVVGRLITFNSKIWFAGNTTTYGTELYNSNGTNAGTVQFMDINGFSSSSTPAGFMVLGSNLLFTATTAADGNELWKSDGTLAGTTLLKNINTGAASSNCSMFMPYGTKAIFTASTSTQGIEPWITDGTATGTFLLKDINPGTANCGTQGGFKVYNNKVYFGANNGTDGNEPWVTDGTTANTVMLKNINPSGSSTPNFKAADTCNTKLIFTTDDGSIGKEPWITDGTAAGTSLVEDMYVGTSGSVTSWHYFYLFGSTIYFQSNTGNTGLELFKLDVSVATTTAVVTPNNDDCSAATSVTSATTCVYVPSTVLNATQSIAPNNCGMASSATANDVWFSFMAMAPAATITVKPATTSGNNFNIVAELFSACGGSVIACADQYTGLQQESMVLTNLIPGHTYSFRVYAFKNASNDSEPANPSFSVCVQHAVPLVDKVQELEDLNRTAVYPNPFVNTLTVSSKTIGLKIKLYDVLGKLCVSYSKQDMSVTIDTADLPKGLYVLQLFDAQNNFMRSEKILKN